MTRFASQTTVPAEKTKVEIESTLKRYGADQFISGWKEGQCAIGFRMKNRMVRFYLPMPRAEDFKRKKGSYYDRSKTELENVLAQEERQRWRALLLVIKAKLEAVESGIAQFEEEFMPHIVLPNGATVGDFMKPQIERAYSSGEMPLQLEFKQ
jgi:hypothetical protein